MLRDGGALEGGTSISKQIGWLNKNGGLANRISYSDVVDALNGIEETQALQILKDLHKSAWQVRDPTSYIIGAATRAGPQTRRLPNGKGGKGKGPLGGKGKASADAKISGQVGWLNKNAGLQEQISFTDVFDALASIDVSQAMKILKDVEQGAASIRHPTGYIQKACQRVSGEQPLVRWQPLAKAVAAPTQQSFESHHAEDPSRQLAKQIGWLNKHAGLQDRISYTDVIEPLSSIDVSLGMKILRDLEQNAAQVTNPTGYVQKAAMRKGGGPSFAQTHHPVGVRAAFSPSALPSALRQSNASAAPDSISMIGKQVGWMNKNAALQERISYSDVIEMLSSIDINMAMKILKDLEARAGQVANPTGYIQAAAKRAGGFAGDGWRVAHQPMGQLQPAPVPAYSQPTVDKQISKTIGWMNKNLPLREPISFSDVSGPLSNVNTDVALKILADLEQNCELIENPTGYVQVAARRAAGGGSASSGKGRAGFKRPREDAAPNASPEDDIGKAIAKKVGWLNKNASLHDRVSYSDVKPYLESCGLEAAMKILGDLEASASNIKNPTAYVTAAAKRASEGAPPPPKKGRAM